MHHIRGLYRRQLSRLPRSWSRRFLCLAISGGNTLIADVRDYTDIRILGSTRDDAAGECFDKTARVLGLPYPEGKPLDELSQQGDDTRYAMPQSHIEGQPLRREFLRPQDGGDKPGPRRTAARGGDRPPGPRRLVLQGREREPRAAHDGRRA
ncbi:MAG: hypothetical protein ACLTSG_08655 [Lachnospiraceae bacterium]